MQREARQTLQAPSIRDAQLDHIAIATWKLEDVATVLVQKLGGRPAEGGPGLGFYGGQWLFARGERIEVIRPAEAEEGFLYRFLQSHGPGIHHVTFKVPDIHEARDAAVACGYDVVGFSDSNPGWKELFLHPKQAQGVVVQLAESDPEIGDGWGPDWPVPQVGEAAPEAACIIGLRLQARSPQAARRQWETLLGGHCSQDACGWVFDWPGSPLRIAVSIEEEGNPGPLGLELGDQQSLPLDGESLRLLGTRLIPLASNKAQP